MSESGALARFAPLTGIAFVVLAIVAAIVEGSGQPEDFPGESRDIVAYYTDHSDDIMLGSYLGMLGIFFLLWFVGTLRARLRLAEGGDGRVSAIAFGGGVAAAAIGLIIHAANLAAAFRVDEEDRIVPAQALALYDLQQVLFGVGFTIALAVLVAGTGVVALRHGGLPRWLGVASFVLAVGLIEPFAGWAFLIFLSPIWIVVVAVLLYLRPPVPAPLERTPAPTP